MAARRNPLRLSASSALLAVGRSGQNPRTVESLTGADFGDNRSYRPVAFTPVTLTGGTDYSNGMPTSGPARDTCNQTAPEPTRHKCCAQVTDE